MARRRVVPVLMITGLGIMMTTRRPFLLPTQAMGACRRWTSFVDSMSGTWRCPRMVRRSGTLVVFGDSAGPSSVVSCSTAIGVGYKVAHSGEGLIKAVELLCPHSRQVPHPPLEPQAAFNNRSSISVILNPLNHKKSAALPSLTWLKFFPGFASEPEVSFYRTQILWFILRVRAGN